MRQKNCPLYLISALFITSMMITPAVSAQTNTDTVAVQEVHIPAKDLATALNQFGSQCGISLQFNPALPKHLVTKGVNGKVTVEQGLAQLLAGTHLNAIAKGNGVYVIRKSNRVSTMPKVDDAVTLSPITVTDQYVNAETATSPVDGYLATRTATATKMDTAVMETPQSISIVTADQLSALKPKSLSSALNYSAGVVSQSANFTRMVDDVFIRGFNVAQGNSGMLRDGMKLQSNVYDGGQEVYGLERIEVLKGPASILYGQISPGGAVNAISKRPVFEDLRQINLEYGNFDHKQASFDLGGAVADDVLSFRLTSLLRDADNQIDHVNDDKKYIAPALTYKISDKTTLTLLSSFQEAKTKFAAPYNYENVVNETIPTDLFIGEPDYDVYESKVKTLGYEFKHYFNDKVKLNHKLRRYSADVTWNYLAFSSLSGSTLSRYPSDRTEASNGLTSDTSLQFQFNTGEVEHTLLAGFDYYRYDYDRERYFGLAESLDDIYNPSYGGQVFVSEAVDYGFKNEGIQKGFYLQDQIKFAGHYVLSLGARYDKAEFEQVRAANGVKTEQDDDAVTTRVGLVYLADNGLAPYASFSQSFSPTIGINSNGDAFKPTEGEQFEVGVRYKPENVNLMLSAAVFNITQNNVLTQDGDFTKQTGEVRSRGFELEAKASFADFDISAAYTYTDARITESEELDELNERVALVPYNVLSFWVDHGLNHLVPGMKLGVGMQYYGSSNIPDVGEDTPSYTLFNGRVNVDLGRFSDSLKNTSLTLNANNLFNEKYFTCVVANGGCRYGAERRVIATFQYDY